MASRNCRWSSTSAPILVNRSAAQVAVALTNLGALDVHKQRCEQGSPTCTVRPISKERARRAEALRIAWTSRSTPRPLRRCWETLMQ